MKIVMGDISNILLVLVFVMLCSLIFVGKDVRGSKLKILLVATSLNALIIILGFCIFPLVDNFINQAVMIDNIGKYKYCLTQSNYIIQTIFIITIYLFVLNIFRIILKRGYVGSAISKNLNFIGVLVLCMWFATEVTRSVVNIIMYNQITDTDSTILRVDTDVSIIPYVVAMFIFTFSFIMKQIGEVYEENQLTI